MQIPRLALSLGQLAWSLNLGVEPPKRPLLNQLNYLRQLGIPFAKDDASAAGSGNRLTYGYDELIECGVALTAVQQNMKLADLEPVIVAPRNKLRRLYRKALQEQPELALQSPWIKKRGREIPILGQEILLILHDRYADRPGRIDIIADEDFDPIADFLNLAQGRGHKVGQHRIYLTRMVLQWTAWALEAPPTRAGRKPARTPPEG